MMKKILIILLSISLFGCSYIEERKLSKLGYTDKEIEIIETYPDEIKELFTQEYNFMYADLIHTKGFNIDYLDEYVKFYGCVNNDDIVYMVNNGETFDHYQKYIEFFKDPYYVEKNKELYLQYVDNYESVRQCVEAINTKSYLDYYTNIEPTDISKDYLMLVNKYYALGSDYEPNDLVDVDPQYGRGRLRQEVYEQYCKLQDDASELGYNFKICSAYRAYDVQYGLYNGYLEEDEGGQASVDTYSARPGHSEHQTGLCLDLYDAVYGMDDFGLSEASAWINENCYKYGFIIRYVESKEKVTGYQAEPWQIRYVGNPIIAQDIMEKGITFDEYYACFVE